MSEIKNTLNGVEATRIADYMRKYALPELANEGPLEVYHSVFVTNCMEALRRGVTPETILFSFKEMERIMKERGHLT